MHKLDKSLLKPLPPFSLLQKSQIRTILDKSTMQGYAPGKPIFEEDAEADRFFLLLDGTIRVVRITESGEQVTTLHIPAGQLFGFAQAIRRNTYPATAVAASEVQVLSWPTSLWHKFVSEYPGFGSETYKTVGQRMGEMNTRIVDLSTQHVEQRVARALLRLVNQCGKQTEEGIEIDFPITRQDVSEMTGTTLHTVSRLLSGWEKSGLVNSKRKKITICDPHALLVLSEA